MHKLYGQAAAQLAQLAQLAHRASLVAAGENNGECCVPVFSKIYAVNLYFPKNLLYSGIYTKYVIFDSKKTQR